jgi:hypothetical protein
MEIESKTILLFAMVAAAGLVGVVVIGTMYLPDQAGAVSDVGKCAKFNSQFHNGSTSVCSTLHR